MQSRVVAEMEQTDETREIEEGLRAFVRFLEEGKMEIRAFPTANIHAKVYIGRYDSQANYGHVITGSSNFSESGLVGQREFNVELKDRPDVEFALQKFEELWAQGVEVTEDFVDTLRRRTWLNEAITPYDIYLKFLYEYFEEDINLDQRDSEALYRPEGFLELEYQEQAVTAARKILEAHNGVFVADVVGLGKTYVTAMLMQQLRGRTLVICPPVLEEYWRETFIDFGIRGYRIESLGKLEHVLRRGHQKYDFVVLDEAHRFRNELTQRYEMLHEICFGKKVICVSATPLNNEISDIYALLKLFQTPRRSTIPGVRDLKRFFDTKRRALSRLDRGTPEYAKTAQTISEEVRDKVLKHVMVRRTRSEIERYYEEDLKKQGLSFPTLSEPRRIVYAFDETVETVFTRTIERLKNFSYARYTPLLYYKGELTPLQKQSQLNIGGFMKSIIVKRLESSFHAFKQTLGRFIDSYERFIEMYEDGTVYLGKDVDVFDLLDNDREERLHELLDEERVSRYDSDEFTGKLMKALQSDLQLLRAIQADWAPITQDPKLDAFLDALTSDPVLQEGKLLVFTEAAETGAYLFEALEAACPGEVMFYSSDGGRDGDGTMSVNRARRAISNTFDPQVSDPEDRYRILVTTDILAEGINLHRSNTVINYDLPWNPTRVLQRVGRINRVGTAHDEIFVYNFFPTAQADEQLNLEANIKSKIQSFHDTLGEDAQYLTDEEEVTSHELFGEELYERLNDTATYEGDDEEGRSELKYLRLLRDLRDNDPDRFEDIKNLPKKARTAWRVSDEPEGLLTFFRRGKLKQFFLADAEQATELTFFEAAQAFECRPETDRVQLPDDFHDRLRRNKDAFEYASSEDASSMGATGGLSNEERVMRRLRSSEVKRCQRFTDSDHQYRRDVLQAFVDSIIPDNTTKRIKDELQKELDPLKALQIVRDHVPDTLLDAHRQQRRERREERREVILSAYRRSSP
jgi:superfamily II DNA or RNA helicase